MGRASQEFDEELFTRKLSELSHQMQVKSVASDKKASAASRGTGGSLLLNIVYGQLALLRDEWLTGIDRIAREVWQTQGAVVTPEFVRNVLMPKALTLIGVRDGVIKTSVERAHQARPGDPYPARHHLAREIRKLTGEVVNRYEIEARELEYRNTPAEGAMPEEATMAKQSSRSGHGTQKQGWESSVDSQADRWRALRNEFEQLAKEEERIERAAPKDRWLRAYCSYKEHPEVWEKGKPEQGLFCLLKTPGYGVWCVGDGVNENFQERFRALASHAGVTLDSLQGSDPEDFWLHRLFVDLRENNSDQLFAASDEGGVIRRVCVASATFCSRLERKALRESGPGHKPEQHDTQQLPTRAEIKPRSTGIIPGQFHGIRQPNRAENTPKPTELAGNSYFPDLWSGADRLRTNANQAESSPAQNNAKTTQAMESKPPGRPRKDAERALVRELKAKGGSWKEIAEKVNTQTGQNKSPEAYRSLLKSPRTGKNGQK